MHFDGAYRLLGTLDIAELRAEVDAIADEEWYADTGRQEAYAPHRRTQTIALIYDPDMRHRDPTMLPAFDRFRAAVIPIMEMVAGCYVSRRTGDGAPYFVRAILVRLGAGERIGTHRDHGYSLARAHRIHVPVRTNLQAEFGIAGEVRHLPAGEAWEINNRAPHAVRNEGHESRVHLILDHVVPGEIVHDPEGVITA